MNGCPKTDFFAKTFPKLQTPRNANSVDDPDGSIYDNGYDSAYLRTGHCKTYKEALLNTNRKNNLIITHLNPSSLFNFISVYGGSTRESAYWSGIDVLIFRGLYVDENCIVNLGSNILTGSETYIDYLKRIVLDYNVHIFWAFDDECTLKSNFVNVLIQKTFWNNLEQVLFKLGASGCEINLQHVGWNGGDILFDLIWQFQYRGKMYLTLPNGHIGLMGFGVKTIEKLDGLILGIIINSFGYLKHEIVSNGARSYIKTVAEMDSKLREFHDNLEIVSNYYDVSKIVMGIDTCGVMYKCSDSEMSLVNHMEVISLREIERIEQVGVYQENGDKRVCTKYEKVVDTLNVGSSLACSGLSSVISYDDLSVRACKLYYAKEQNLRGVCIGDIMCDFDVRDGRSTFMVAMEMFGK